VNIIKTKSFELAVISKGNEKSKKLAIAIPGRLDTKDYANFVSHVDYLANRGYFALAFDPPGTWGSSGGIQIYTTTNYLKAIDELIEYFGNKPTLLLGHSRGGTVAMLAGTSNLYVACFVAIMATYGIPTPPRLDETQTGVYLSYRDFPPGTLKTRKQKKFALPLNYFKDGEKYYPIPALKNCPKPKLLFYGTDDEFTKPEKVKEIYETIPEPKMIHELNSDHDYRYHPKIVEEVNNVIGQFLDKYTKE